MKFDINISERELEDYLVNNISKYYPNIKIIKRQYNIACGIIDLLAKECADRYLVIELKIGELNSSAVCQVLRYTQYLNSEKSKNGKRRFFPLLIGSSLNEEIIKLVKHYDDYVEDVFYCYYDLFSFGIKGINLGYFNINNEDFMESAYKKKYTYYTGLEGDIIKYEIDICKYENELKEKEYKNDK